MNRPDISSHRTRIGAIVTLLVVGMVLVPRRASVAEQVAGQPADQATVAGALLTYLWAWSVPGSPPLVDNGYKLEWEAQHLDLNGLPLNADWAPHQQGQLPVILPSCMHPAGRSRSTCDSVPGSDRARGLKLLTCKVAGSPFPGHVNWGPATVEGAVSWGNLADDNDINFFFEPVSHAGLTAANHTIDGDASRPYIELEFDSAETLQRMATDEWKGLNDAIIRWATEPIDSSEIDGLLNANHPGAASRSVVTGLFGLDCEHGCPSEVHPVLGLAIESNDSPDHNTWVIFARNWGNEGFCSRTVHLADTTHFVMSLPGFASGTPSLTSSEFASTDANTPHPTVTLQNDRSIVVDFTLPPPGNDELVELVLHITWAGAQAEPSRAPRPSSRQRPPFTRVQHSRGSEPAVENLGASLGQAPQRQSAVRRNTKRTSTVVALRRGELAKPARQASRRVTVTKQLVTHARRRARADQQMLQAACRNTGDRLPGLTVTESTSLCAQVRQ